ncbi:Death-associated protein kinase 1 [Cucumis melo var. makuwa]|uniref:Death-associated protein kinase 1 n=1 Tax=Cucumis melo var. makuwa TaxID=1194695 RepID=A0A5A7T5Z0_CUCMM|nr:Death-associated protein kinase 1 [Cucumis melo var. makuwa]
MISMFGRKDILKLKNDRGNTPLHVAAAMGCARMCGIIGSEDEKLVDERNKDGETPLFLAALHDHKNAFYCLYDFCKMDLARFERNCRRHFNGDTILHCALKNEQFDLAFDLIHKNNEAASWVDEEGNTPLHVLASEPSAFKSGAKLTGWKYIAYQCICVDKLKPKSASTHRLAKKSMEQDKAASFFPNNYATCIAFFTYLWNGILVVTTGIKQGSKRKKEEAVDPCNYNAAKDSTDLEKTGDEGIEIIETHESDSTFNAQLLKPPGGHQSGMKKTLLDCYLFLWIKKNEGFDKIRKLQKQKQKHTWSIQVMEKLLELAPPEKYGQSGDSPMVSNILNVDQTLPYTLKEGFIGFSDNIPKLDDAQVKVKSIAKDTPILLAAKYGVVEMVSRLFQHFPLAISESDKDKKNVVLLAAEYRQPDVYEFLLKKKTQIETLFRAVDKNGDSALHLAARLQTHKSWRITGVALQMQWEAKWYQYVRDSVHPNFFVQYNNDGMLAKNIFHDTHQELAKAGAEWLFATSKSCSVLATLVVTVAYASATTVPGGNGDKGTSPLEKEMAFFIFTVASPIALCLSTTSLIMFLAILTSRFNEEQFSSNLPGKLLMGFSSIFLSIVAMLVSFCAGHYFLLSPRLHNVAVVIYLATSLPVALFFIIVELPLYFDLFFAFSVKHPRRRKEVVEIETS